jgi:hypothetical protein
MLQTLFCSSNWLVKSIQHWKKAKRFNNNRKTAAATAISSQTTEDTRNRPRRFFLPDCELEEVDSGDSLGVPVSSWSSISSTAFAVSEGGLAWSVPFDDSEVCDNKLAPEEGSCGAETEWSTIVRGDPADADEDDAEVDEEAEAGVDEEAEDDAEVDKEAEAKADVAWVCCVTGWREIDTPGLVRERGL